MIKQKYNNKGTLIQEIHYFSDGTLNFIDDFNPLTGEVSKFTQYNNDGTIDYIEKYKL